MRSHSVVLRILVSVLPEPLSECVATTLFFMATIQIITAMTIDGFFPEADNGLMQWVKTNAQGVPYWRERSLFILPAHYPLLNLLAEKQTSSDSDIYIAEIFDKQTAEFLQGLSRYHLIDEMVIYTLPIISGSGIPVFENLTGSRWKLHKAKTFSNGISRIVYRNSRILQ